MPRYLLRALMLLFGGLIASQAVELALTSQRGQDLARRSGLVDLTSHKGIELARKHARDVAVVLVTSGVALLDYLDSRVTDRSGPDWPGRLQVSAQVIVAVGALSQAVSSFLDERKRLGLTNRL